VSERCYKSAYTTEEAYNMIIKGECGVFSPKLMNCFAMARAEFEAVARNNRRKQEAKHA
jgi:putative two-component system response regulator